MKYYLDQEFHSRFIKKGWWLPKEYHIIELISIGIVAEDGREYYAISKDFDVSAAFDNEWLRDNVLAPIHIELYKRLPPPAKNSGYYDSFSVRGLKRIIHLFGKTNKEIASDIFTFINPVKWEKLNLDRDGLKKLRESHNIKLSKNGNVVAHPQFYGYYADYDWVLFCSLYGLMTTLPEGYPQFCNDLKQILNDLSSEAWSPTEDSDYPMQEEGKEHNALEDARFNRDLHKFLIKIKNR